MAPAELESFIRIRLVFGPVSVKEYTLTSSLGSDVTRNQLHEECRRLIEYKKTC